MIRRGLSASFLRSIAAARQPTTCTRPVLSRQRPRLVSSRRHLSYSEVDLDAYSPSEHDRRYGYYDIVLPDEEQDAGPSMHRLVPPTIPRPPYVDGASDTFNSKGMTSRQRRLITDPEDLVRLQKAARLAAQTLRFLTANAAFTAGNRTLRTLDLTL